MWRLSQDWYGDRLAADYRPRSVSDYQGFLSRVGLDDLFWQL